MNKIIMVMLAATAVFAAYPEERGIPVTSKAGLPHRIYVDVSDPLAPVLDDETGTRIFFIGNQLIRAPLRTFELVGATPTVIHPETPIFDLYVEGADRRFRFDSSVSGIEIRPERRVLNNVFGSLVVITSGTFILTLLPGSADLLSGDEPGLYGWTLGISVATNLVSRGLFRATSIRAVAIDE